MPSIALENVSKVYPNGVVALRGIDLTVARGEFLVVVGPSGSGKTTLLRLLAGLEDVTVGTVCMNGRAVNTVPAHKRNVAMVFQRHSLYPHMTVRQNLAFALRLRGHRWRHLFTRLLTLGGSQGGQASELSGISEVLNQQTRQGKRLIDDRVTEAAKLLELEDVLDRGPAELSGGQQQRVALGKALVRRPGVYLLDEPLSQLDARLRTDMRRYLHLLHRRLEDTIIHVTHDQMEATALGDRIAVLNEGTLQQADSPAEIYERPRNRFVAGFIGWPSMNFMEGQLAGTDADLRFAMGSLLVPVDRAFARTLAGYHGKPITLGIRPEHVIVHGAGRDNDLAMEVVLVERLGADRLVDCRRGALQITARMPAEVEVAVGRPVQLRFDMERAQWFDSLTGLALSG
jgi:multiple sugar transport system ATP-binding protein